MSEFWNYVGLAVLFLVILWLIVTVLVKLLTSETFWNIVWKALVIAFVILLVTGLVIWMLSLFGFVVIKDPAKVFENMKNSGTVTRGSFY
jgi:hypothetical protein